MIRLTFQVIMMFFMPGSIGARNIFRGSIHSHQWHFKVDVSIIVQVWLLLVSPQC